MRSMKNSGIEWIGKIPNEWSIMPNKYLMYKIKQICPIYDGKDILSLTMNGVIVRDLDAGGKMPQSFDGYQYINSGNLLMCLFDIDVTPRCVGLIKSNGLTSPAYSQFQLKSIANPEYYCYYYTMLDNDKTLLHLAKNLRHSLTEEQLGNVSTVVPPLCEQEKIAAYLDRKCSEIDALTADIQKQIETLEEYKRSLITEAVTKGLDPNVEMKDSGIEWIGKIPAVWQLIKGKYIFAQRNLRGNSIELQLLSPTQKYGVIPQSRYEELSGMNTVKINDNTDLSLFKTVHIGDFCISLRSFQGGFEYSLYEGVVSPAYQIFYSILEIENGYYKYLFKEQGFISKMNSFTMTLRDGKNIAFSDFGNSYIPVPPLCEQQAIAAYLDQKCSEIDSIIKEKQQQLETLAEYKKSLIYEYVTGKKEVVIETTVTAVDPLLLLIAKILDNIQMHEGKIRVIKLALLSEYLYIPELKTQYYRYPQGAYDVDIDKRLNEINKLGWFDISVDDSPMTWKRGKKYNEFKKQSQNFNQYDDKIIALIKSIGNYRESHIGRISTLFAAWNDFIIDGVPNPSDKQIIQEVVNNWTPNKAKTAESNWRKTLEEMKSKGIIPQGKGLHTKKKGEK